MNIVLPALVADVADTVDVVFALRGQAVARDHAQALRDALVRLWPWLQSDAVAGIHPLRLVPGTDALSPLSLRARLLLRVSSRRMADLAAATDVEIDLMGQSLRLGPAQRQALRPHSAMYAYRVAAPGPDEVLFMAMVDRDMARLGIVAARVCGQHQPLAQGAQRVNTFSLLLHEMTAEHAQLLQQHGLGGHRLLGCGVFVPHKSAAAV